MIVIIDYGLGNLGSVTNILKRLGIRNVISSDPEIINDARKLILPGVGAFDNGMENLNRLNLVGLLNKKVNEDKIPLLGICLGAQLILKGSEEGNLPGLGWIGGQVIKFKAKEGEKLTIPHMGWNQVQLLKESKLFEGMFESPKFYFVHSYHFKMEDKADEWLRTHYSYDFCSAFERGNIAGVQFHPEKSHKYGMTLLSNFVEKF
jgi:glutamine amidotransferase